MRSWRPFLAAVLLAGLLLAGCSAPKAPPEEILGSTGIVFPSRPIGGVNGVEVVWDAIVRNDDNTTSAAAHLHLSIKSSPTGLTTDRTSDIAPLAPHASRHVKMNTPYDGPGDYSGVAEILVGPQVVGRAFLFFEQCQAMPGAATLC